MNVGQYSIVHGDLGLHVIRLVAATMHCMHYFVSFPVPVH